MHNEVVRLQFEIRKRLLEKSLELKIGHLGSCFSVIEIIITILLEKDFKFDNFILSKGHTSNALTTIFDIFELDLNLKKYHRNTHPTHKMTKVPFSTGSLGQGITYAAGVAYANFLLGQNNKTYVLISDAELNSGSTFEALQFIINKNLKNIIIIVDNNGQQATDFTRHIINNDKYINSLKILGFDVNNVNGHNISEIQKILSRDTNKPLFLNCKTTSGYPLPLMMGKIEWHYKNILKSEMSESIEYLDKFYAK